MLSHLGNIFHVFRIMLDILVIHGVERELFMIWLDIYREYTYFIEKECEGLKESAYH